VSREPEGDLPDLSDWGDVFKELYKLGGKWLVLVFVGFVLIVLSYWDHDLWFSNVGFIVGIVALAVCVAAFAWKLIQARRKDAYDRAVTELADELSFAADVLQSYLIRQLPALESVYDRCRDFLRMNPALREEFERFEIDADKTDTLITDASRVVRTAVANLRRAAETHDAAAVRAELQKIRDLRRRLHDASDEERLANTLLAAVRDKDESGVSRCLEIIAPRRTGRGYLLPIHEAVRSGELLIVIKLLAAGADPDARDSQGLTPLMRAVESGREDIVAELLRSGASVNAQDRNGRTALLLAAESRSIAIARRLTVPRGDPDLEDNNGRSALSVAKKSASPEMFALLNEAQKLARLVKD